MKKNNSSCFKMTLYLLTLLFLMAIPVLANWSASITTEDVKLWKMWLNLAISGYTEPMPMQRPGEKPWWRWWE